MNPGQKTLRARYIDYTKNTQNFGDECVMWIIQHLLAPEIDVSFDAKEFDIALLGGGTLINQSTWLIDEFQAALNKARVGGICLGTGVGDLTFWGNHFDQWTPLLEQCREVAVRGPESAKLLNEHGVAKATCVGDPFLCLNAPIKLHPTPKRLGVNFGSTNDAHWGGDDQSLFDHLAEGLSELKSNGWSFIWISVWEKDVPWLEKLRLKVDPDSPKVTDARSESLKAFSLASSCEVFLGEKLHANALAAVAGTPFVALEYQPKVSDFAASLHMTDWVISTDKAQPGAIVEHVEKLREQRGEEGVKMTAARDSLRDRFHQAIRRIKQWALDFNQSAS